VNTVGAYTIKKEAGLLLMIFILSRGREGGRDSLSSIKERMSRGRRGVRNKSILAMEIHFISTSTSIAVVIFFIQ